MTRQTKIVCTIGPACDSYENIKALIQAGMDVARLNFSHGNHEDHKIRIKNIRKASEELGKTIPLLQDLQGPKIRVGEMKDGGILLHAGAKLRLTANPKDQKRRKRVYISYPHLLEDVEVGGRILIDDGNLELLVTGKEPDALVAETIVGGILRSRKGVNLPHIRSNTPALTEKDLADLAFGIQEDVDWVALSFVRHWEDVRRLKTIVAESGKNIRVIAKIEKPEAITHLDKIIEEADGVMIARGDLGIEIPMSEVPLVQKMIIRKCLDACKPVITATQMLDSMIENPRPTRAEASDVANAVLDGTDAVMLSGETASGAYPIRATVAMEKIIKEVENNPEIPTKNSDNVIDREGEITQAICYTAYRVAERVNAKAIACLTYSGITALAVARHRPKVPVYAFTPNEKIVAQLGLVWGVKGMEIGLQDVTDTSLVLATEHLQAYGLVTKGDRVVFTVGMPLVAKGTTNSVVVIEIP